MKDRKDDELTVIRWVLAAALALLAAVLWGLDCSPSAGASQAANGRNVQDGQGEAAKAAQYNRSATTERKQ